MQILLDEGGVSDESFSILQQIQATIGIVFLHWHRRLVVGHGLLPDPLPAMLLREPFGLIGIILKLLVNIFHLDVLSKALHIRSVHSIQ
jgi:hypothetical protein